MRHVYLLLFIEHTESILGIISGTVRFSNKGNGDKLLWKFHLQEYSELSVHTGPLWLLDFRADLSVELVLFFALEEALELSGPRE